MGRKFPSVSFLWGAFNRKRTTQSSHENENRGSPESVPAKLPSPAGESPEERRLSTSQPEEPQSLQPIPPPPGHRHMRTASCHHHDRHLHPQHHSRSNSAVSKLTSTLSMGLAGSRREDPGVKKLKHEDSIWKKTIILGGKCRVPEEDDDTILYDENGNRISSYHPRNNSRPPSISRQNSRKDPDSVPQELPRN